MPMLIDGWRAMMVSCFIRELIVMMMDGQNRGKFLKVKWMEIMPFRIIDI